MSLTKRCSLCNKTYKPKRSDSKFCSRSCKDLDQQIKRKAERAVARAEAKKKKLLQKDQLFDKTAFAKYLIAEARRAKTVEILKSSDFKVAQDATSPSR